MTDISKVTVLGTGVLGSQIAYQASYAGFDVSAWDINDDAITAAKQRYQKLAETYEQQVDGAKDDDHATKAAESIHLYTDIAEAVADADLVIEAVPENPKIKEQTWTEVGKAAPAKTIFATNSSTLLPSSLMEYTGRPEKFLALHFANMLWVNKTAEVMGTAKTDQQVYQTVVDYASKMGMVPIEVKKEKAGYVLNSLLVPLLNAASELLIDGVADVETVDKTWRLATGAPLGPFQIFDVVGLTTAYNISAASEDPKQREFADYLKTNYIDKGKLGVATGEGFYSYS